ncbi:MAG TPA: hypothetical protein VG015_05745, partial [Candidatus Dormibacteraeota bacterium]|nr:hypothetical protein [Candidatus Dormibacteraeota bacterium]
MLIVRLTAARSLTLVVVTACLVIVLHLGQMDTVTDRNNQVTSYAYDVDGNLNQEPRPGSDVLNYTYDAIGRPATISDPTNSSKLYTYGYDSLGRLGSLALPNG